MTETQPEIRVAEEQHVNVRLDSFLVEHFPGFSRAKLQRAVTKGQVLVDGKSQKSSLKLKLGQSISIVLPSAEPAEAIPEDIPLDILHEDDHVIAVNKQPAMVVHPAKGHWSGTLTSALAFHFGKLSTRGGETRPGIVHRLDRDTTGVILVAKTDLAHQKLSKQFEMRTVEKEYWALVSPPPDRDRDLIEKPIGIHPYQREKMAIREDHRSSRQASTFYEVIDRYEGFGLVRTMPKTGRTHQIRVHLAHIGCPVLCDKLYSGRSRVAVNQIDLNSNDDSLILERQALHARRIQFTHPVSEERIEIVAPVWPDFERTLELIRSVKTKS